MRAVEPQRRQSYTLDTIENAHTTGQWDKAEDRVRRGFIAVLRGIATGRSASLPATRARARKILTARGIGIQPAREVTRRATPADAVERAHQQARYLGIVRMQIGKLREAMAAQAVVQIKDAAPSVYDAADMLVRSGEATALSDEMVTPRRGRRPAGEMKRRAVRVMRLALAHTAGSDLI